MSNRTPYDTGKRSEPKVWGKGHIEDDDDYGKVDFEDDAGGTLATLYIEKDDDGTYAVRGYAWDALKIDIESNDPSDEDITITMVEQDPPQVQGFWTIHWFPGDLVEWRHDDAYGAKVSDYGVVSGSERTLGTTMLWVYVPGHSKPRQWPAAQCRLLRRNGLNKEEENG